MRFIELPLPLRLIALCIKERTDHVRVARLQSVIVTNTQKGAVI